MPILKFYLLCCSKVIFFKHNPRVIIVGSDFNNNKIAADIYQSLLKNNNVKLIESFQDDVISVFFEILNLKNRRSPLGWINIIIDAVSMAFFAARYPKILIFDLRLQPELEINYLLKLLKPRAAVFYKIEDKNIKNYKKIAEAVSEKGIVFLNQDEENQRDFDCLLAKIKYFAANKLEELNSSVVNFIEKKYFIEL